jgi:hypothetical protein
MILAEMPLGIATIHLLRNERAPLFASLIILCLQNPLLRITTVFVLI